MIRFTQTDKWEDKWFRRLTVGQKLIFMYLCDKCDLAGFIEWDGEMVSFQIGVPAEQIEGALKGLDRGIVRIGDYIWIKNFLKHQKNTPLNPNNPAHKNIIRHIAEHEEFHDSIRGIYGPLKPLFRGIGIGKGISKGNSNSNGNKEEDKELVTKAEQIYLLYPRHINKATAVKSICKALKEVSFDVLIKQVKLYAESVVDQDPQFIPYPSTWFNNSRWEEDPEVWKVIKPVEVDENAELIAELERREAMNG